jgi:hypothetical protein
MFQNHRGKSPISKYTATISARFQSSYTDDKDSELTVISKYHQAAAQDDFKKMTDLASKNTAALNLYLEFLVGLLWDGNVYEIEQGWRENITSLREAGACELISDTLLRLGTIDKSVANKALKALSYLAFDGLTCKKFVEELGACDLVVNVFRHWGEKEPSVAEMGCLAIAILALAKSSKNKFGESGAGELVLSALNQ